MNIEKITTEILSNDLQLEVNIGTSNVCSNIIPSYQNQIISNKINKTIELVIVPKLADQALNQLNIGIDLEEDIILNILSQHYQSVVITEIKTLSDLTQLIARKPDLVFSGVKYFTFHGKNLWLNDYLDAHNIAYIASNRAALDREHDKACAKMIMQNAGIDTADFFTAEPGEYLTEKSIPIEFPLFIKPVGGGDSIGVNSDSIVTDFNGFQAKILEIYQNQKSRSLVETYLSGKEYSVAILENSCSGYLEAMPIEIIVEKNKDGHRILDFEIKKNDSEKVIAVTNKKIYKQLSEMAKAIFKELGGKSLGRIDIKMNHEGTPHFIEANLMPGLKRGYFYRACSLNLDMSYEEMILSIADTGLSSIPH